MMDFITRYDTYTRQNGTYVRFATTWEFPPGHKPFITPAQRRRLNKKANLRFKRENY